MRAAPCSRTAVHQVEWSEAFPRNARRHGPSADLSGQPGGPGRRQPVRRRLRPAHRCPPATGAADMARSSALFRVLRARTPASRSCSYDARPGTAAMDVTTGPCVPERTDGPLLSGSLSPGSMRSRGNVFHLRARSRTPAVTRWGRHGRRCTPEPCYSTSHPAGCSIAASGSPRSSSTRTVNGSATWAQTTCRPIGADTGRRVTRPAWCTSMTDAAVPTSP